MKQNLPNRNRSGEGTDERIRRALTRRAETVRVSSQDSRRMIGSVHRKIEEENRMRKWSAKKIVVVAAAVCVFGTITAVAAGKIAGIASYSSWNDAVYQYSKVADMERKSDLRQRYPRPLPMATDSPRHCPGPRNPGTRREMWWRSSVNMTLTVGAETPLTVGR